MIRVLIVDDDSLIHVTLRSLLVWENLGYTVVQDCSNGNQALNYLKNHAIDLLITDMKMPGMGGLELMQRLRQQG
ncbi:MAG TPA: DNA-binding response regulator, partial [Clostridiales bacterium]|nr:DNA-binding response regulator [Clostridiales bacterium]